MTAFALFSLWDSFLQWKPLQDKDRQDDFWKRLWNLLNLVKFPSKRFQTGCASKFVKTKNQKQLWWPVNNLKLSILVNLSERLSSVSRQVQCKSAWHIGAFYRERTLKALFFWMNRRSRSIRLAQVFGEWWSRRLIILSESLHGSSYDRKMHRIGAVYPNQESRATNKGSYSRIAFRWPVGTNWICFMLLEINNFLKSDFSLCEGLLESSWLIVFAHFSSQKITLQVYMASVCIVCVRTTQCVEPVYCQIARLVWLEHWRLTTTLGLRTVRAALNMVRRSSTVRHNNRTSKMPRLPVIWKCFTNLFT